MQRKVQGKWKDLLPLCEREYMECEIISDDKIDNITSLGGMDSDSDFDGRLEGVIKLQNSDGELLVSCKCSRLRSQAAVYFCTAALMLPMS